MFKRLRILFALSGLALLATLGGCVASLQAEPVYVESGPVPVNIEIYPHTYYEGRTVYYVDNHWRYRDGARWAYYREEPAPLYRQRSYVQQAPPADRRQSAPPRVQRAPAAEAPPRRGVERRHDDHQRQPRRESRSNER